MREIKDNENLTPQDIINNPSLQTMKKHDGILLDKSMLPSNGVFYPNDIYVTPFTGMDLKDLTNIEGSVNQVLYKILSKRVKGVEITDILTNDKLWFIYYIRNITYKNRPIQIKCTCPECGAQSLHEFTFEKLNIEHYNNHLPSKQLKMPNEDMVEFTFPTIGTENAIVRLKNNPANIEPIDDQFMLLASYIKTINGKKLTLWDAYNYVQSVDAMTFCFIINTLDKYTFTCDRTADFVCPECGAKLSPIIEMDQEFFIPKLF